MDEVIKVKLVDLAAVELHEAVTYPVEQCAQLLLVIRRNQFTRGTTRCCLIKTALVAGGLGHGLKLQPSARSGRGWEQPEIGGASINAARTDRCSSAYVWSPGGAMSHPSTGAELTSPGASAREVGSPVGWMNRPRRRPRQRLAPALHRSGEAAPVWLVDAELIGGQPVEGLENLNKYGAGETAVLLAHQLAHPLTQGRGAR